MTFKEILAEIISARILEREPNVKSNDYTEGFCKAYKAWEASNAKDNPEARWQNYDTKTIILGDILNGGLITPEIAKDFFTAAKENGIETIIVTDRSTALMETIHALADAGAEIAGLTTTRPRKEFYNENTPKPVQAIAMIIPKA